MAPDRPPSSEPTISFLSARSTGPLIVTYRNGHPSLLSDVADVIDDAENVKQALG